VHVENIVHIENTVFQMYERYLFNVYISFEVFKTILGVNMHTCRIENTMFQFMKWSYLVLHNV
jgi:hypothetical protein